VLLTALDSQFKLAKEFNSEVSLRFKLWKAGFMANQSELPGLLSLEEESLKVFLNIMFHQFFKDKETKICQPLFPLCSKVLKDYVLKHSELESISASKGAGYRSNDQLAGLHEQELGKQLSHMNSIVANVILENMMVLDDKQLTSFIKDQG
jgi:hypothetical protein